jgi:hypothetical protein
MSGKNIFRFAIATALLLLVPLIARWPWSLSDFIVAGALLFGSGVVFELVANRIANTTYRIAVGLAVASALILVWINLAVGIIGSENNPANLMYLGVLAIGLIGAVIARFQPRGMSRALFAMAFLQVVVPVVALLVWNRAVTSEPPGIVGVFILNLFFAALFAGSALLFRRADHQRELHPTASA